jgi:pheromone shutdown protein TraB
LRIRLVIIQRFQQIRRLAAIKANKNGIIASVYYGLFLFCILVCLLLLFVFVGINGCCLEIVGNWYLSGIFST